MKLEYIKLENFSLIQSAMNLSEIELDFRRTTNTINLIIGSNGSGKTALLSNLHPFATLGRLEARDDMDLIVAGKDGKKTAIFSMDKHEFYIEHFYQYKQGQSRKISSYIKKDGIELNPSGTVTGFLDVVNLEMDIDVNFLKLIRLGGNVTNFIELTHTGRMTFIGKLLTAIEPYMKYNKIIRNRSNELTANLKNAVSKLNKLNVSNISLITEDIKRKQELLDKLKLEKERIISEFNLYSGKINVEELYANIDDITRTEYRLREIESELNKLGKNKFIHLDIGDEDPLTYYYNKLSRLDDRRNVLTSELSKLSANESVLITQKDSLDKLVSKAYSSIQLKELNEYIEKLKRKIDDYHSKYTSHPEVTLVELTSDVDKINSIIFEIDNILTCDDNAINYFCKQMLQYNNNLNAVHEFAHNRMLQLQYEINSLNLNASGFGRKRNTNLIMFIPTKCDCFEACPYYNAYQNNESKGKSKDVKYLEYEYSCLEQIDGILSSIHSIRRLLSLRNDKIRSYSIDEKSVMLTIRTRDKTNLMDSSKVMALKEHCEEYDEYIKNSDKLREKEHELQFMTINRSKEDIIKSIEKIDEEISSISTSKTKIFKELKSINDERSLLIEHISDYQNMIREASIIEKLVSEKSKLLSKINEYHLKDKLRVEYSQEKHNFESNLMRINSQINELEKAILEKKLEESSYNQLTDEINNIKRVYEYIEYIKEATSSTEGIPLYHVKMYCKSLCNTANEIIRDLYTGDFKLLDFNIEENTFTIPYYTKGYTVKDIKDASQAESSVAKIAISFAILSQFMTKYNIILLDEIDGPMHRVNKEKFFSALEGVLDRLNCEQVFLITQSTMFNEYPVNLIVTDPDYKDKVTKDSTVVFQR